MASPTLAPSLVAPATPPATVTDYRDTDTLWKWNVLCQSVVMVTVGILFLLRTYVRLWVKRSWILEDCE